MLRLSCSALIAALLFLTPGAVLAQSNDYTPSAQAIAALSTDQALKILNSPENAPAWLVVFESDKYRHQIEITNFKASLGRLEIRTTDGPNPIVRSADLKLNVSYAGFLSPRTIDLTSQYSLFYEVKDPQLRLIADALAVLQNAVRVGPQGDPAFAQVVASYRAAQPKPQLSEDVRRYQVQAKAAINDMDFTAAASYYSQALQIAPWWPGGHFNRAAVLAEIGEYDSAIDELQPICCWCPMRRMPAPARTKFMNGNAKPASPRPPRPAPQPPVRCLKNNRAGPGLRPGPRAWLAPFRTMGARDGESGSGQSARFSGSLPEQYGLCGIDHSVVPRVHIDLSVVLSLHMV